MSFLEFEKSGKFLQAEDCFAARNVWGEGVSCRLVDREGKVVVELRGEGKE